MTANDFVEIALASLKNAVKLETESKYAESLSWYEKGLELLIVTMKMPNCEKLIPDIKKHTLDFMKKAELLKDVLDKENRLDQLKLTPGQHQQIKIEKNSTGHSYHSIFNKFLVTRDVSEVWIEDPYIRDSHQISNFVHFCEMLIKSSSNVKQINLLTSSDKPETGGQIESLEALKNNLRKQGVTLIISYNGNLHDREIRFSNGWIIKIGRGLDYFRRLPHANMLGQHDFDFRLCLETTIDIFHKQSICGDK